MSIVLWTAVVLIGGAGSVLRFLADGVVESAAGRDFPLGTLAVNVSGAVILGLLTGLALGHDQALLAGTAAVGSYTTFSTWMLETQRLTEERQHRKAVVNVAASLVARGGRRGARPADRPLDGRAPMTEYQKLTSYFGERHRIGGAFVADTLLELYGRHEIAASILLRGTEGFGLKHHLRTDRSLTLSEDLPLVAVAVDTRPRIEAVLAPVLALNPAGLVTLEGARLLDDIRRHGTRRGDQADRLPRPPGAGLPGARLRRGLRPAAPPRRRRRHRAARRGRHRARPPPAGRLLQPERRGPDDGHRGRRGRADQPGPARARRAAASPAAHPGAGPDLQAGRAWRLAAPGGGGEWQKLMVYTSEAARHQGQPVHRAIVRRLRSAGISGATTLRGIWGFHGDHAPHGDRLLQLGRHVPTVTIVIDTPERIATAYRVIDELTSERGLVTCETISRLDEAGLRAQARS